MIFPPKPQLRECDNTLAFGTAWPCHHTLACRPWESVRRDSAFTSFQDGQWNRRTASHVLQCSHGTTATVRYASVNAFMLQTCTFLANFDWFLSKISKLYVSKVLSEIHDVQVGWQNRRFLLFFSVSVPPQMLPVIKTCPKRSAAGSSPALVLFNASVVNTACSTIRCVCCETVLICAKRHLRRDPVPSFWVFGSGAKMMGQ